MRWLFLLLIAVYAIHSQAKETNNHRNHKTGRKTQLRHSNIIKHAKTNERRRSHKETHIKLKHKTNTWFHPTYHDVSGRRKSTVTHEQKSTHQPRDDNLLKQFVDPKVITIMRMLVKRGNIFAGYSKGGMKIQNNARSTITHYVDPKKFGEILLTNSKSKSHKRMDIDINVTGKRTERVDPSKLGLAILKLMFGDNANLVIRKSSGTVKTSPESEIKKDENNVTPLLEGKHELSDDLTSQQTLDGLIRKQENNLSKQSNKELSKQTSSPALGAPVHFDTDMGSDFMKAVTNLHGALEETENEQKGKTQELRHIQKPLPSFAKKSAESSTRNMLADQINELLRKLKPVAQKKPVVKTPKLVVNPLTFRGNSAAQNVGFRGRESKGISMTAGNKVAALNPLFTTTKSVTPNENLIQISTSANAPKTDITKDISSVLEFLDNEDKSKKKASKPPVQESPRSTSTQEMTKQIDKVQQSVKSMMLIAQSMEKAAKEIAAKIKVTPKATTPATKPKTIAQATTPAPRPKTIAPNRKSWVLLKLPKAQAENVLPFTNDDMISQIPYEENPFNKEVIGFTPTRVPVLHSGRPNHVPAQLRSVDQTKVKLADSIQNLIAALRSSLKSVTQETPSTSSESFETRNAMNDEKPSVLKDFGTDTMRKLFTEESTPEMDGMKESKKIAQASDLKELTEDLETFAERGLQAHNRFRTLHHSKPLRWSDELATQAEKLAYDMAMKGVVERSEVADVLEYGENVARVSHVAFNNAGVEATKQWYNQVSNYSFNDPRLNPNTDAFTQVVWSETTQLGMGCAKDMQTNDLYVVALYKPHGNIVKNLRHDVVNKGKAVDMYSTIFKRNDMILKKLIKQQLIKKRTG